MNRISIIIMLLIGAQSNAQDVHFTMFHVAPTLLNPASVGMFNGTFRASSNYKSQWGSVSSPYKTIAVTTDGAIFKNRGGTAHMGVALAAFRDVAGTNNFGTTKIDLSLSSILELNDYNSLSIGLTGGWAQRSIRQSSMQWDSQFDGQAYDFTLPSNENYTFENTSHFDFAAGAMWSYGTSAANIASFDKFEAHVGAAYHHLSRPELEAYFGTSEKQYAKLVFHGDMQISQLYSKMAYRPRISAFFQGPSREINIGMMFRYLINEGSKYTGNVKGLAINLGGYYRVGDALSPSVEIEISGFSIGYSYDFNTSGLRAASSGFGGSEFYLKFQNPNPFFKFSRTPSIR